ncbi:MAG: hypothetical protein ACRCV6_08570 [Formosimonas sp.]
MNILVIGGSNSLMKNGYVDSLSNVLKTRGELNLKQLSVGGTSSITAIARLLETFAHEEFDFILYEYSINDNGHLGGRPHCAENFAYVFALLVKTAAKLYPTAVLVPLIFSAETTFARTANAPFYEMQKQLFASLDVHAIDIRAQLSELFLDLKPDWLYLNEAHYSSPHGTTLVGSMVAAKLLELHANAMPDNLTSTLHKINSRTPFEPYHVHYLTAHELKAYASANTTLHTASNRLMSVDYLHMPLGSQLNIERPLFPLALVFKSDKNHGHVHLLLDFKNGTYISTDIGTCHADTQTFNFIYSSLPLPLLFRHELQTPFEHTRLELNVTESSPNGAANLDTFNHVAANAQLNHLDLIGILYVNAV